LQSGVEGTSITLAPPLTIEDDQLARAIALLDLSILDLSIKENV
jgi:4-aminobutyrate aminotransferase-like enzyme